MDIVTPSASHVWLFMSAALALLLIPGPAVLYIVGRSMDQGRGAGLISITGVHLATLVHVTAAAVGLSALLASSALAFTIVKFAGAGYLVWVGLRKIFGPARSAEDDIPLQAVPHARLLLDGFIVNLLNPKTALFFLAFLPQFVDVGRGAIAMQVTVLGLLYTGLGLVTDGAYAMAAGTAGNLLKRSRIFSAFERYVSGILMIGLGMTAALSGGGHKQ